MKNEIFPSETILAIFPPEMKVEGIRLYPLTFNHVAIMAALGIDATKPIDGEEVYTAAWIMSQKSISPDMMDAEKAAQSMQGFFTKLIGGDYEKIKNAVNAVCNTSCATYIPGKSDNKQEIMKRGNGWILELAEALAGEYGWRFAEVLDMPVCRAFALAACARTRNGGESGAPSYWERVQIKSIKAALKRDNG